MKDEIAQAYDMLGVTPDATDKEMRSAWRKLVRTYHPDLAKTDPEEASRRMGEINAAYDAVAHHRLKTDKVQAPRKRRASQAHGARTTKRTSSKNPKTHRPRNSNDRRPQNNESATREKSQQQASAPKAAPKRATYRSVQEQRLIDAACAVFEETRRKLNAAAQRPAFSACR